jgi:NADH dehydrogenase FAD-containing subunit
MVDLEARGGALIAGGGFAGSYVARKLGRRGATIVTRENFMLFTPMLPEAASGTLEPRHAVVPLRVMCPTPTSSSAGYLPTTPQPDAGG